MAGNNWNRVDEFNDWEGQAEPDELRCKSCGSTDVRWRQQGGKWVLFSSTPGVQHVCPNTGDAFDVVPE
jgi:hypothetical protein